MSFVPFGQQAQVTLGVVAYGSTDRLRACVDSLLSHESAVPFDVVVVLNPDERRGTPSTQGLTPGVHVITPDANLGWAGGMHLVRHATSAAWLGWIQDDSEILPGWLDAHWTAAQNLPDAGALGAVAVDDAGRAVGRSGGWAPIGASVAQWNDTDPSNDGSLPVGVESRDWLTSKGLLVRTAAWDEVGGACARQYPLNHVDKEFSIHLRCHGWQLYVVPGAQLLHLQSQSAPGLFRTFLADWQEADFDKRWASAVAQLAMGGLRECEHDCHRHESIEDVERECLVESTRMLVPFSRYAAARLDSHERQSLRDASSHAAEIAQFRASTSWKVTAPLRWLGSAVRRLRGRS